VVLLYLVSATAAVLAAAFLGGCLGWTIARPPTRRRLLAAVACAVIGGIAGLLVFEAGVVWERDPKGMSQAHWYGLSLYSSQWASFATAALGACVLGLAALRRKTGGPAGS
jgi:ABC-type branched-subunit amino acid transport system permease subunit